MREVDRIATEELGLDLVRMMENAGSNLAELAIRRFDPRSAIVLVGRGGNGGGGLVAARHLANRGVRTGVVCSAPAGDLASVTAEQLAIARAVGVQPVDGIDDDEALVVDALVGYSLAGALRGRIAALVDQLAAAPRTVLALDVPSGLDATTGEVGRRHVRATATMTLALPKCGFIDAPSIGELYLADISIPAAAYARLGLAVPAGLFAASRIVQLI